MTREKKQNGLKEKGIVVCRGGKVTSPPMAPQTDSLGKTQKVTLTRSEEGGAAQMERRRREILKKRSKEKKYHTSNVC